MSYPLDFAQYSLEFSDGGRSNKHYTATLLHSDTSGNSVIIRRWGKIGVLGEIKIEKFAIRHKAEKEFEALVESKLRKGYEKKSSNIKQINSEGELRMAFGPAVWPKLPGSALQHVIPNMDVTGRRELDPNRFDENGKYIGEPPARTFSQAEIKKAREAEKEREQEEAVKTYSENPRFGMF
jgi:predicted DNA-binding WGR domain protein